MRAGPLPWSQFLLACWPLWLILGTVAVLGLLDWHANRVARRG